MVDSKAVDGHGRFSAMYGNGSVTIHQNNMFSSLTACGKKIFRSLEDLLLMLCSLKLVSRCDSFELYV